MPGLTRRARHGDVVRVKADSEIFVERDKKGRLTIRIEGPKPEWTKADAIANRGRPWPVD